MKKNRELIAGFEKKVRHCIRQGRIQEDADQHVLNELITVLEREYSTLLDCLNPHFHDKLFANHSERLLCWKIEKIILELRMFGSVVGNTAIANSANLKLISRFILLLESRPLEIPKEKYYL